MLDEWKWLIGRDREDCETPLSFYLTAGADLPAFAVTIASLLALPAPPTSTSPAPWTPRRPSYTPNGTSSPSTPSPRSPTKFVMLMSDGRAYLVSWSPPPAEHTPKSSTANLKRRMSGISEDGGVEGELLFDEKKAEEEQEKSREKWRWEGVCFHPAVEAEKVPEQVEAEQEKQLDKGKGGSTVGVNDKMGLVAVGCEE